MTTIPAVAAVITTFNNPAGLAALIEDLRGQDTPLHEIIVIDNSTSGKPVASAAANDAPRIVYVKMAGNAGSAGGFSEGIRRARENNDLVWTFDDDIRIVPGTLTGLLNGLAAAEKIERIGAVCCFLNIDPVPGLKKLCSFPWKGTLMRSSVIQEIGLPLSGYFMYAEDLEYSLRFSDRGYAIYAVTDCIVREQRQNKTSERKGFYRDPFRLYYAFRNEINTYLLHRRPLRLIKVVLHAARVLIHLLSGHSDYRSGSAVALLRGIRDGFRPVRGMNTLYRPTAACQRDGLNTEYLGSSSPGAKGPLTE